VTAPARPRFIEPLVQESTPSIIADKLRKAIGHGELKPGMQLGEADLARKLGVSRGPLREGMQRLTQEGLLVSIRNRGLFVIDMTPDDVRDMYLAREAIEQAAAHTILRGDHATAATALLAIVDEMAAAMRAGDPTGVGEADITFHERLVELANSPRLRRMHQTFITETRMCIHALEETYVASDIRVGEHRAIAEAIGAGDAARVRRLLSEHTDDAIQRLTHR
jgi:DNA-binding GntR family transcriptional regulator